MGFFTTITRLNPEKVLRIIILIEMLFWSINAGLSIVDYYSNVNDAKILHDIEARYGTIAKRDEASRAYKQLQESWKVALTWSLFTSIGLFFVQLFLHFGVSKKNRCVILCWILFCLAFGVARLYVVTQLNVAAHIRYMSWIWIIRGFYIFLALKYMLLITNERLGQEQVDPPEFRPQTDDPREFRGPLNYPVYPRSLEFSDRVMGYHKMEHADPKRWQESVDAFDPSGRMVTVVDEPYYDNL